MSARRLAGVLVLGTVVSLTLLPGAPAGSDPGSAPAAEAAVTAAGRDDYRETKTVTRVIEDAQGNEQVVAAYDMTVQATGLTDLRGRERVELSWSGAPPSGGRASNPYGEDGMLQEYPVVVLQCRGTDDPGAPKGQRVSPETCWTSSVTQRSQPLRSLGEATWTVDRYADEADRQPTSGMDPFPDAACPNQNAPGFYTHITPFIPRKGDPFPSCTAESMAPEAAVDSAFPPSELAAFTDTEGNGSTHFEVRTTVENESLGCSEKVRCTIVVVPIVGISCDQPSEPMTPADRACRQYGNFAPGSSNFAKDGVDQAVSPSLWWAESNWRNRFSIPITFGLPPDACDVLDPRPPTGFYGSELMAQAALQWAPAYCLDKKRFKFQLNQMPDAAGWNLMETGGGPAAFVSSKHKQEGSDPVGYAPTAVTGFSVGYIIDRPGNAGEFTDLRLNARLLAKLLTQSYLGSALGEGHPGIGENPWALMTDPEFVELNPGLTTNPQEAGAALMSLSNSSDIIAQVTEYIAQDRDAMAFVNGKPDPWGMKVNPSYKGIELPRAEWPLLDTYVPETEDPCRQQNEAVYFSQIAAPVTTLRKISEALIDAWPYVQTRCDIDAGTGDFKLGRIDRQAFGSRFLLGIVSLGDAERYGLHQAALETSGGRYVAPSQEAMAASVRLAEQKKKYGPFSLPQDELVDAGNAYPGTMVVYTAARLQNLEQAQADQVAAFIRIATSEGQRAGRGNGELPDGYLPIRRTGVTADLWRAAQETADAIEAQRVPEEEDEEDSEDDGGADPTAPVVPETGVPEDSETPSEDPSDGALPEQAETVPTAATQAESSGMGKSLLPILMVVGLLAGVSSVVSRFVGSGRS